MSAPALGQVVFVTQPQPATGFDVGIVTANLGAGQHVSTAYMVSALLFTTDPASGVIKPIVVEAELYADRTTATNLAPGNLTQPQSASVL